MKIFDRIGSFVGVFSSFALILNALGTASDFKGPLKIVGAIGGVLGFGLWLLVKERINQKTLALRALYIIGFSIVSVVAFVLYWLLMDRSTVHVAKDSDCFFPLYLRG